MKNLKRSGAEQLNHDKKMRLALDSRPRRGHTEVCNIFYRFIQIAD